MWWGNKYHLLSFISSNQNLVTTLKTKTKTTTTYYGIAPWFLIWHSQWFKQTRLRIIKWKSVPFIVFRACEICQKRKLSLPHPIKKSEKSKCSQLSVIKHMYWVANICKTLQEEKGRKKSSCCGRNFKIQWEQDKNPTELSRDTWSTRAGKRDERGR